MKITIVKAGMELPDGCAEMYQKLGYKIVGKIPDLYIKGITEYLMARTV